MQTTIFSIKPILEWLSEIDDFKSFDGLFQYYKNTEFDWMTSDERSYLDMAFEVKYRELNGDMSSSVEFWVIDPKNSSSIYPKVVLKTSDFSIARDTVKHLRETRSERYQLLYCIVSDQA